MRAPASRTLLKDAFAAAVAAADPAAAMAAKLPSRPAGRSLVVGGGKAVVRMAEALEGLLGVDHRVEGLVVAPHELAERAQTRRIEVAGGAHPIPDPAGVAAARRMLSLLDGASEADQVIVLLSGGGSSLLGLPLGLTLPEYQELFRVLLASGAEIGEMNVLRRRFGALAGGRLAARAAPASVTALVVSDVVGDTLHDIASGPTCPDPSSDAKVLALLQRYAPGLSMARELVAQGEPPRAPSRADPLWARVENHIVVSNSIALLAAQRVLERAGWPTLLLSAEVTGEAREAAAEHAAFVREVLSGRTPLRPPLAIISGGETTVSMPEPPSALRRTALRQTGRGGRNSEFALALALALGPEVPIWALIADSDGIDGVGGHAGAFLTPELFVRLSPREAAVALESHDSLSLFEAAKHDFVTGPTGTNVNDLRILLIAGEGGEVG